MWDRGRIDGVRSGDARAWAEMVRASYPAIYRMLTHLTRDPHAAEDLCQETFAAAWAGIHDFAGDCAIGTWLHRIAYRKFLDARRWRRQPADVPVSVPDPPAPTTEPLAGLMADEETRAVHAALARLGDTDQLVIVLHYLHGLSYREVSEITGEPVGTIKWRTSGALQRLGDVLDPAETTDEQAKHQNACATAGGGPAATDPAGA